MIAGRVYKKTWQYANARAKLLEFYAQKMWPKISVGPYALGRRLQMSKLDAQMYQKNPKTPPPETIPVFRFQNIVQGILLFILYLRLLQFWLQLPYKSQNHLVKFAQALIKVYLKWILW